MPASLAAVRIADARQHLGVSPVLLATSFGAF
jgi:hypothetical protein